MLSTLFLSAICALSINVSATTAPVDTLDKYIIDGEQVTNFDGSQLVGKTISDYKVTVAKSNTDSDVVKVHVIRTDGLKTKEIKSTISVEGVRLEDNGTEFTIDGKKYSKTDVTVVPSAAVYLIDGKKCDKDALVKIKPESIASLTVYKPGSKEAKKLSGKNNVTVIEVVTK